MTVGAHFQINQAANPVPSGTADTARTDLRASSDIHFVGDASGNASPSWTITSWPVGAAHTQPANPLTFDATYNQAAPGDYRMLYTVNDGTGTNRRTFIFTISADVNGIVYDAGRRAPAFGETVGDDNTGGNDRSYAKPYEANYADFLPRIATHANLLNVRAAKHSQIYLAGFYSARDGGEGPFFWDGASTEAHLDGICVQPGRGTAGAMATGRWKRHIVGNHIHAHQAGLKPDDPAFNNAAPWTALATYCSTNDYDIDFSKGTYWSWQTVLPSTLSEQNTTVNWPIKTRTRVHGAVRGGTIWRKRTPLNTGGGDPSVPADIPMIPHTRTAMQRSHVYGPSSFAFANNHSYFSAAGGTTSANLGDQPSGIFPGTSADGTVLWEFADSPYRGGVFVQVENNSVDWLIEDITIQGGSPWVDNVAPPPYITTGTYQLWNSAPAVVPLMYATKSYNQVTYAFGWDVLDKGFALGELASAPQGLRRGVLRGVEITGFRGEAVYGDGGNLADPDDTVEFDQCEISEAPAGYSSMVGAKFTRSRFRHLDQALDFTRLPGSVLELDRCLIDDCRTMLSHEGGLLDQAVPGFTWVHHCRITNVYYAVLSWINSFSANLSFTGQRGLLWENNMIRDCAWGTAGGVVYFVAGPSTSFPTNPTKVRCSDVTIRGDRIHCGALLAPARSGSGTGTNVQSIFNIGGWVTDFAMDDIECVRDQAAIDAGHHFFLAGYWQVQSNGDNCRVRRNLFRGGTALQGLFLIDATTDQYIGDWSGTRLLLDDATQEWPITLGGFNAYSNGSNLFPKFPVWYARGAGGSVLTTVAAVTHPERWAAGQIVELRNDDEGSPLLIPAESATHTFPAPRLLTPRTRLRLRRGSTSNSTDTPHWYEDHYFSSDELTADFIGPLHPPNVAIESYAPGIQTWGVHIVHLASGTYGYFINAPDEDGLRVQVYLPAGGILRHNSAVAPAGTVGFPKLLLKGSADYTFLTGGEAHFIIDNDTGLAVEVLRIDGTTVFGADDVQPNRTITAGAGMTGGGDLSANRTFNVGQNADGSVVVNADDVQVAPAIQSGAALGATAVQPARAFTGGTGIFIDGDHAPHNLSANRTITLDPAALPAGVPTSRTLTGATPIMVAGDHAAHDLSADRTISLDPAANITTTGNITAATPGTVRATNGTNTAQLTPSGITDGTNSVDLGAGATFPTLRGGTEVHFSIGGTDVVIFTATDTTFWQNTMTLKPAIGQARFLFQLDDSFWLPGRGLDIGTLAGNGSGNGSGGTAFLQGGQKSGSGLRGGASLCLRHTAAPGDFPLVEVAEVTAGRFVTALCRGAAVTSVQVPTGERTVFINDSGAETTSAPTSGATLESISGVMKAYGRVAKYGVTPDGPSPTGGQASMAEKKPFASHVETTNASDAVFLGLDLSVDGMYQIDIDVMIDNHMFSPPAIALAKCTAIVETRSATVRIANFPHVAGTDAEIGPGTAGAKIALNVAGTVLQILARPGAGHSGHTLDWSGEVVVRRHVFS